MASGEIARCCVILVTANRHGTELGSKRKDDNAMPRQINEVYAELGQVLESPQAFGLGPQIPQALADRLESMRRMLEEALKQPESLSDDGREHYLAVDTCRF
jgi:hypothetical protein